MPRHQPGRAGRTHHGSGGLASTAGTAQRQLGNPRCRSSDAPSCGGGLKAAAARSARAAQKARSARTAQTTGRRGRAKGCERLATRHDDDSDEELLVHGAKPAAPPVMDSGAVAALDEALGREQGLEQWARGGYGQSRVYRHGDGARGKAKI